MKIMVVGGGGREHALVWKVSRSPLAKEIYACPGNAGTVREKGVQNIPIEASDIKGLLSFARDRAVDLVIVGPEAPLVEGLCDMLGERGIACFGPTRSAARLEGSKVFTKEFLLRHGIPTADYKRFTDPASAAQYIEEKGCPIVVKADGLAAGKGVVVARTKREALDAVEAMLVRRSFGDAGRTIILEECLEGEEASFIVMTDGSFILPLATSQDHKARNDNDMGPNTGGMGAYSPAPVVDEAMHRLIMDQIITPTIRAMEAEGNPYKGFLYAGLMIGADRRARVLEFNCRLGDPEAQPILMRLESDIVEMCLAAVSGGLSRMEVKWDPRPALGVVMTAGGYPEGYRKGDPISGLPEKDEPDTKVFHAGTRLEGGRIVTWGGRVLCVTALGESVKKAQDRAYELARRISWKDCYYRSDIGHRAIRREAESHRGLLK
jgi:phosphoribosylamine--glycine ligase